MIRYDPEVFMTWNQTNKVIVSAGKLWFRQFDGNVKGM